jgi:ribonuclease Z
VKQAKDADVLLHEATFLEKDREKADETKHSTALDAAKVAKEANAKQLVMFHLSTRHKDTKEVEAEAKKEFDNSSAAFDSMEILV